LAPVLAGLTIALVGCSSPAPGLASGSASAGTSAEAADLFDASASGLSAACSAVIDGQAAIAALFAEPVDGQRLSKAEVGNVFGAIGPDIPSSLGDDVEALRDAADRAVGKSDVAVASILAERKVSGAMAALSAYVKDCTPETS